MFFKRLFLYCFPIVVVVTLSFGQNVGLPRYLWVASYGTDTYADPTSTGTPNAQLTANSFYSWLYNKVSGSSYANNIALYNFIQRQGATDIVSNFKNDRTDLCEFLVFAGHGQPAYWYFYDTGIMPNGMPTRVDTKPFGNYTKWIFTYACNTMQPYCSKGDPYYRQFFTKAFNGVHGFFGFGSVVWGDYPYNCGFLWLSKCHYTPDRLWDEFFQRWVINKETMNSAWFNSVWDRLYQDMHFPGVVPVDCGTSVPYNGDYIYGIYETIDHIYDSPMPAPGSIGGLPFVYNYSLWGNPQY